jgi:predicted O-methyltransferase YrrM
MSLARLALTEALYGYLDSVSEREPDVLRSLRLDTLADPDHGMAVCPMEGQFLAVIARMIGARKLCEVGVYTGYSSLSMALALPPDAHLWAFDVSDPWTAMARKYWRLAGVDHQITLWIGPGDASMRRLVEEGHAGTLDLVFIDANKRDYLLYWNLAHQLLRTGGVVLADNVLFQGVVGPDWTDERLREKWAAEPPDVVANLIAATHAIRAFNRAVHHDTRFATAMVPVADGMTFGVKL